MFNNTGKQAIKLFFAVLAVLTFMHHAYALNKIRVKEMKWRVIETPHFKIHYYDTAAFLARLACVYAEEAYERNTAVYETVFREKIPMFIYENSADFSATNITLGYIGEGTGGFTEPFKNRVVLPNMGSFKGFKEVITHELSHAFQFNILYGEGFRSYNVLYKDLFVPLWIMEGLSEYSAEDSDTVGEMVMRDAVVKNRLAPLNLMDSFSHLSEVYLAYKEAQSAIEYMAMKHGKQAPGKLFSMYRDELGTDAIFKKVTGKSFREFASDWEAYARKKYWAQALGREEAKRYGPALTKNDSTYLVYNQSPAVSPDGRRIAYLSTAGGVRCVYVMNADGRETFRPFKNDFENLTAEGRPISWAPDSSHIYFAASDRGRKVIIKGNVDTGKIEQIKIEGIDYLNSPAVSPDGSKICFTGVVGGISDIYLFDTNNGKVSNITNNIFDNTSPCWSPDGKLLAYTEERNGHKLIVILETATGKKFSPLKGAEKNDSISPWFLSENEILYSSDKGGVFDIYLFNLKTGEEKRLTNVITGAFSPSAYGDVFAYAYYEDGCYNIYRHMRSENRNFAEIPLNYNEKFLKENKKDTVKAPVAVYKGPVAVAESDGNEAALEIEEKASELILSEKPYSGFMTPDILFGLLGAGTDTGVVGGAYMLASDMTGDNNLQLIVNAVPDYFTQFDLTYLYMALPFDLGIRTYYNQNAYRLYDAKTGEFFSRLDTTELGTVAQIFYPFNIYDGFGITLSYLKVADKYTDYATKNNMIINDSPWQVINTATIYYESSHLRYRDMAPFNGYYLFAYAQDSERMFGGTTDFRVYGADAGFALDLYGLTGRGTSVAISSQAAMSEGNDRPYFLFGGPGTVRGLPYGLYTGDHAATISAEIHHVIAKNLNFDLWPITGLLVKNLRVSIFSDSGLIMEGFDKSFDALDVKHGFGAGVFLDMFLLQRQYVPLVFMFAKRTDITDEAWKFYFYFSAGF